MRAIRTNQLDETYSGRNIGPDCADLPCKVENRSVTAVYKFTDAEREQIAAGAHLEIVIFQTPMPPIALGITDEEQVEQWQPDDLRCANDECGSVWRRDRDVTHCGHCGGPLVEALQT